MRRVRHISIHGTSRDFLVLAPIVVFVARAFKKDVSLRKYAGNFYDIFSSSGAIKKSLYGYALRNCNALFFETKYLVGKFKKINEATYWRPNVRKKSLFRKNPLFEKRFVFISQVKRSKGVLDFIDAASEFGTAYKFDIYGPILESGIGERIQEGKNVNYKGILNPKEVTRTLVKYDVLVLPTYHDGEGYPGIIIEAFSCGVPVIASRWNSIPEIVKDGENGFLIKPRNIKSLKTAIMRFSPSSYKALSKGALNDFNHFESEKVNQDFIEKTGIRK